MLEILRVVVTNCGESQYLIRGEAEQVPQDIWHHKPDQCENAVWGVLTQFGGRTSPENPGPGDVFETIRPVELLD